MRRSGAGRTTSSGRAAARPTGAWLGLPRLTPAAQRGLLYLLTWIVVIGAACFGLARLRPYAELLTYPAQFRLKWANLPAWLIDADGQPSAELSTIEWSAGITPDCELLAGGKLDEIAGALLSSPWIESVRRLSAQRDGVILVDAQIRTPAALVVPPGTGGQRPREAYLVDQRGVRLPMKAPLEALDALSRDPKRAWFSITGVKAPPPPEGQAWLGEDLGAGLRLVLFLNQARTRGLLPFRAALRAVDVANFDGRAERYDGKLRIRTIHPRAYIDWGLPPGEEYNIEADPELKLRMLRAYHDQFGYLPDNGVIVLRWPDPTGRVTIRPVEPPVANDAATTRPVPEHPRLRGRG